MPALSHARESAKRTSCLSNLHQVHLMVAMYAQEYKDVVPIGYRAGKKGFNSMIYSGTSSRWVLFGWLRAGGYMKEANVFFCPAENDPRSQLDTPDNPWPPGDEPGGDPTKNIAAGYGFRPETEIADTVLPGTVLPPLTRLKSKAILGDITAFPQRVDTRHRNGINVLRGDGSARWVARSVFELPLSQCTGVNAAANPFQDQIWKALDDE